MRTRTTDRNSSKKRGENKCVLYIMQNLQIKIWNKGTVKNKIKNKIKN